MKSTKSLTLTGVAFALAAGGVSKVAIAGIDAGGAPAPKKSVSKGKVKKFGSIFVNGVRFDTDQALFIIDGAFGIESDLTVGQVVTVVGSVDEGGTTGTAWLVTYDDVVDGPISNIDAALNRMTVLGQTVIANNDTSYSTASGARSIGDLAVSESVEVSGYVDADGNIVATHITSSEPGDAFDLTGAVDDVDADGSTLTINGLVVDYSNAWLMDLPTGVPQAGQRLEIVGSGMTESGHFVATEVRSYFDGVAANDDAQGEIEGLVTGRTSFLNFELDGVPVRIDWNTSFVNGWLFGVSLNRHLEVEGTFGADGVLLAETIEFESESDAVHSGYVEAVDGDMVWIGGIPIRATIDTEFEDDSDADEHRFNVGSIRTGDYVAIWAYEAYGEVVATRIERDDDEDDDD